MTFWVTSFLPYGATTVLPLILQSAIIVKLYYTITSKTKANTILVKLMPLLLLHYLPPPQILPWTPEKSSCYQLCHIMSGLSDRSSSSISSRSWCSCYRPYHIMSGFERCWALVVSPCSSCTSPRSEKDTTRYRSVQSSPEAAIALY